MVSAIAFIILCGIAIVGIPMLALWMLNTLFKLNLAYDTSHWFAALLLVLSIGAAAAL